MSLQATQIVSLATQIAGVTGFTQQAGQLLNMIQSDLCKEFDFDLAKKITTITLGTTSGPYPLPADYLRAPQEGVFYTLNNIPYFLINVDLAEFDAEPQQPGINNFPTVYATDMSQSPPALYVWPPSNSSLPLTIRYFSQMPDISVPELSTAIPWFPHQNYLITRLAGEVMKLADDTRSDAFLAQAKDILDGYLKLKDDSETRSKRVTLDKRFFRPRWGTLPNTKKVGI